MADPGPDSKDAAAVPRGTADPSRAVAPGATAYDQDAALKIENLHARPRPAPSGEVPAEILRGVDLTVGAGEVHALMGPNGCGKTTLANVVMGNPFLEVTAGRILLRGEEVTSLTPDERARRGLFLAFQQPEEVPGVPVAQFLRQALSARRQMELSVLELRVSMIEWMKRLGMDPSFADRYLNEGFSGGERKRNEILQMAILEPEVAILDETDSGLDIDSLKVVSRGIQEVRSERPGIAVILITHFRRLLDHIRPDRVHIMVDGRIVESGGPELAEVLDSEGYQRYRSPSHLAPMAGRR